MQVRVPMRRAAESFGLKMPEGQWGERFSEEKIQEWRPATYWNRRKNDQERGTTPAGAPSYSLEVTKNPSGFETLAKPPASKAGKT